MLLQVDTKSVNMYRALLTPCLQIRAMFATHPPCLEHHSKELVGSHNAYEERKAVNMYLTCDYIFPTCIFRVHDAPVVFEIQNRCQSQEELNKLKSDVGIRVLQRHRQDIRHFIRNWFLNPKVSRTPCHSAIQVYSAIQELWSIF